jgi:hypothetical protein
MTGTMCLSACFVTAVVAATLGYAVAAIMAASRDGGEP